jgi:hypothetical protein
VAGEGGDARRGNPLAVILSTKLQLHAKKKARP